MDIDFRPLIVLAPVVLVVFWAAYNIISAAIRGEAKLFGARGNNPFAPENSKK
ncbi:MAG: photosystem II protein Y [Pseudanabaenaceae cyanobacterium]